MNCQIFPKNPRKENLPPPPYHKTNSDFAFHQLVAQHIAADLSANCIIHLSQIQGLLTLSLLALVRPQGPKQNVCCV